MEPYAVISPRDRLPASQREALVKLLADDDIAVYRTVRKKILSFGEGACAWLRPHALSSDPVLRRRVQEIIRYYDRQTADNRFLAFCLRHGEEFDLEEGAWLLARTQYPDINVEAYQALLDSYAGELAELVEPHARASKILAAMNAYLFDELGFTGNETNYYDPENNYLNRVVDRRTGNPINLCLLYLLLARRLRLPVAGINLPGHFLCRFQSSADEIYVDAFNRGRLLTKADCVHYLVRGNYDLRDDYLAPVKPRRLLMRVCANLHQIYVHLKKESEATRFQRYLVALAR